MRRLPLPIVLFVASVAAGPKPAPLPPLNAKVESFARENLGRPVGDGICTTLAIEALRAAGARRGALSDPKGDYTWGQPVPEFRDVLPGDILQFRDAVFRGKRAVGRSRWVSWHHEYPHHTAIVARVAQDGKLVTVLHQNITTQGRPESEKGTVQLTELRMDSLREGGWVRAYRPVSADAAEARKPFADGESAGP